jgi:hypothetical protein
MSSKLLGWTFFTWQLFFKWVMSCKFLAWMFFTCQLFFQWVCLVNFWVGHSLPGSCSSNVYVNLCHNYLKAIYYSGLTWNIQNVEKDASIWYGLVPKRAWLMDATVWLGVLTLVWKEKVF